jgi:hypothetical protein
VIPILHCPRRAGGDLTADADSSPWRDLQTVRLVDAVTARPPNQGTEVRAFWNDDEWRLIFHATDKDPWATMTKRDANLYEEEVVEVFFDPAGDLQSYFEIEVNPLGAVLDLVLRKNRSGYKGDIAWDCEGLRTLVRKHPGGWTTEMAIPFASVTNSPPIVGSRWRGNFYRIDRPSRDGIVPRELTAWSPPMRPNFHTPEKFGIIEFAG